MRSKKEKISSTQEHKAKAAEQGPVGVAIVTVSDTRTKDDDVNGLYLKNQIQESGNRTEAYHIVKDEPNEIEEVLERLVKSKAQVIIFNGGTGISKRDRTFDLLNKKFEKTLPGFGEIFRMLSYNQVGAAAMFSRAAAGIYKGKVILSTPGSPQAVTLVWEKLIAPELPHLAWEINR